jgi:hypothetical protein
MHYVLPTSTFAAMPSAGLRGYISIIRYKPCLRELLLANL